MRWQSWRRGLVLRPISSLSAASSPSRIAIRRSRSDASAQGACWGTDGGGWSGRVEHICPLYGGGGRAPPGRLGRGPPRAPEQAIILPARCVVFWVFYQLATGVALLAGGTLPARPPGEPLPPHPLRPAGPRRRGDGGAGAPSGSTPSRWARWASPPTLARALPPDLPLLVTTVTPTGQERARRPSPAAPGWPTCRSTSASPSAASSAGTSRAALMLVEGDYWPLVLARGPPPRPPHRRGQRPGRRPQLPPDAPPAPPPRSPVRGVGRFGVQSGEDRDRLSPWGSTAAGWPSPAISSTNLPSRRATSSSKKP